MFGGWRIVKTMGQKITKLKPVGGFCAETGGAITLFLATALGIPVSTTHTITGAIVGVGSVRRAAAVRWGVAGNIVWAWIFTIPAAGVRRRPALLGQSVAVRLSRRRRFACRGGMLEVALRHEGDVAISAVAPSARATTTPNTSSQPAGARALAPHVVPRLPLRVGHEAVDDRRAASSPASVSAEQRTSSQASAVVLRRIRASARSRRRRAASASGCSQPQTSREPCR